MSESIDRFRARYFGDAKPALLALFDPRGMRILDLGCGGGHNGEMLKRAGARWVGGVEHDSSACAQARKRLDAVKQADLATFDPAVFGPEPFDTILASDVLEHLREPHVVLARSVACVRPGGLVVASIPNVAQVVVFYNLLRQRWPRRSSGIFDYTHLRFFGKRDMMALLEGAGLRVIRSEPYFTRYRALRLASLVLSLYVFRDYWARQFLLVAEKPAVGLGEISCGCGGAGAPAAS